MLLKTQTYHARAMNRSAEIKANFDNSEEEKKMREITSHKTNRLNEALTIEVLDDNTYHTYRITVPNGTSVNKPVCCDIEFQKGPIAEVGINGISNEALLAIVEDRLLGFQSGGFYCRENALALIKIQEAMMWLQRRDKTQAVEHKTEVSEYAMTRIVENFKIGMP